MLRTTCFAYEKKPMKKGSRTWRRPLFPFFRQKMAYCNECVAVKDETVAKTAVSLACRSWHCDQCAPKRKKQLIAEAMGGAPCTFLTLTFRVRAGITPDEAAPMLSRAWRIIRKRLMRKYHWKRLPFLAVMEKTKRGWPHIHLLLRSRFIPWKLLSKWMAELCDSPNVLIEKIDNKKRAAGYCAKYCSKAAEKFPTAKRYWQSQDYDLREPPEKDATYDDEAKWQRRTVPLWQWVEIQILEGQHIIWTQAHKAIAYPHAPPGG